MKSKHLSFQLAPSMHRTGEIESGLLLTPTSSDATMSKKKTEKLIKTKNGNYRLRNKSGLQSNAGLCNMILMLPTPKAHDGKSEGIHGQGGLDLATTIKLLPTPTTPRPHDNEETAGKYYPSQNQKDLTQIGMNPDMRLQPAFVEWMMGYPIGWTDLKD
jgi:hypothetical protein